MNENKNTEPNTETSTVFEYKKLELRPSWNPEAKLDLRDIVLDVDLFEHIDKPWLTGVIAFQDTSNLLSGVGVATGDRVEIEIKRVEKPKTTFIHKYFRVDKIIEKVREGQNENTQIVILHLVEEIWYESNAVNVNKSYEGKPYDIIKNILESYIKDRSLTGPPFDVQEMKVIVPNMTPLDAACWVKNRATNNEGFPIFLFSTVSRSNDGGPDHLIFLDLETMLNQKPWTEGAGGLPFNNFHSTQHEESIAQRRTIKKFEQKTANDFQLLIQKGLFGARHQYIDVTDLQVHKIDYDHEVDINQRVKDKGVTGEPLVMDHYTVHDAPLNQIKSYKDTQVGNRLITQIGGTNAYDLPTINESTKTSFYKHVSVSRAMKTLLAYDSLIAVVDGHDFTYNTLNTVGTLHTFMFKSAQPDPETFKDSIDRMLTGNYLIYAAKHSFKKEGYDVTLTATKLTHRAYHK